MTLSENVKRYYDLGNNCAVSTLLGAGDHYGLGLTKIDASLLAGFGGGMGCGKVCGCLAGSIAILGRMFSTRPDFRTLCGQFVREFEKAMNCGSVNCVDIAPRYKTKETKCWASVKITADLLEDFISRIR